MYSKHDMSRAVSTTRPIGVVGTDRKQHEANLFLFFGGEDRPPDATPGFRSS